MSDIPQDRIMRVLNNLRRQGIESTPDEVRENLVEVARKVRVELVRLGWEDVPESDVGVLNLMAALKRKEL